MYRRFRRRKPRVQWLPEPGTALLQNGSDPLPVGNNPAAIEFVFGTTAGVPTTVSAPLVVDNPVSETVGGTTIPTWQNFALNQTNEFGWRLRRIVGDIFIVARKVNDQSSVPPGVLCQAGIIVRRVAGSDGQPAASTADQDVGTIENESDPWVWRRNWALSEGLAIGGSDVMNNINGLPSTNLQYGTKHHIAIDQKTARRLGPEERLFLTFTAWQLPLNTTNTGNPRATDDVLRVYVLMPYRILGTVFTSAGNRRNASR